MRYLFEWKSTCSKYPKIWLCLVHKETGSPQGQWNSTDTINRAAGKYDSAKGAVQVVDINTEDERVIHILLGQGNLQYGSIME